MLFSRHGAKCLTNCLRIIPRGENRLSTIDVPRNFSLTSTALDAGSVESTPDTPASEPTLVSTTGDGRTSTKPGEKQLGSRRRRAALKSSSNVPFEQLPYQCFQEARQILQADREEKLQQISVARERIRKVEAKDAASSGGEAEKQGRLRTMRKYLEDLKILSDINDPVIKKRFEDGEGDMNRPIYRYLANKQWRSYRRPVLVQRLTQMSVVPDVLPALDPVVDTRLYFRQRSVQPGDIVDSRVSEVPARLRVQVFDKGERLVSVIVLDSDVPDLEQDRFNYRCHFIAANVPISPTSTSIPLFKLSHQSHILLPWLPPYAQKGSPGHRISTFIVQQPEGKVIDAASLQGKIQREGFNLRSFLDKHGLRPIGAHMFRIKWDEGTAGVMSRIGVEGADVELRRKRVEPLKKMPLPLKKKQNRIGLPSKRL
ncbi:MAG: hypothetical protein M1837_001323 [Sclerophora amabilis]|nr:MAG: hypothetical protein M1837_001323 [Sclerophora amabilis]